LNKDDGELYLQNSVSENIILDDDLDFKYSKNCPTALISEGLVVGGC
jgi:hypothetical protein